MRSFLLLISRYILLLEQLSPLGKRPYSFSALSNRLVITVCFIVFAFIALSVRVILLSFNANDYLPRQLSDNSFVINRADIVDRNGTIIARDLVVYSVYADPKMIINPEQAARQLAHTLKIDYDNLYKLLSSDKRFVWVKRNVTPKEQWALQQVGIPGVWFQNEQKRVYPQGSLFSHVVGYVDIDNQGIAGIERYYNKELQTSVSNIDNTKKPLQISLDTRVQSVVHKYLKDGIQKFSAEGGMAVVMDVNNGEVISMVSLPDFDPHYPGSADEKKLFNRASLAVHEFGSIMKPICIAAALDSGKVKVSNRYDVGSPIAIGHYRITDFRGKGGWQNVPQILVNSSNIGMSKLVLDLGKNQQQEYLRKVGFMSQLSIELPEKGFPLYPSASNWSDITAMTVSYGYGISMTPVHVLQAISTLVNGGKLYNATLLKHKDNEEMSSTQIFKESTSNTMRKLLRLVTTKGTGKKANIPGYMVAGKTGTAYKLINGRYDKNARMASFVGVFPIHQPRYAIIVTLDNPRPTAETFGFATGGWNSAPISGSIIAQIAPLLGIYPVDEEANDIKNSIYMEYEEPQEKASVL